MKRLNIALDGPAGAGKSTIAKKLAEKLGVHYLDTGAMYRAFAYKVLLKGKNPASHADVLDILHGTAVTVAYENGLQRVYVDGCDVTDHIRTPEITRGASDVAVFPEVRIKLVEIQRQVAIDYDVVMDGRDIGTYVIPETKNKFFLTASVHERARRRHLEFAEKGIDKPIAEIEADIAARDKNDSEREFAPLKRAEDAVLVDTTEMTIDEVAQAILERITGN
jgi:cytidylate kinase